ncbi:MAG: tail fiber domain-containing protein, partial [Alphaproteobacteria bacterium]|nr:tail fiber domain-containing protein [Alphaproteobacteria bacterium]
IQFNSGGSLGTDTNFVYTSAGRLGIGTATPSTLIHAVGGNSAGEYITTMKLNDSLAGFWKLLNSSGNRVIELSTDYGYGNFIFYDINGTKRRLHLAPWNASRGLIELWPVDTDTDGGSNSAIDIRMPKGTGGQNGIFFFNTCDAGCGSTAAAGVTSYAEGTGFGGLRFKTSASDIAPTDRMIIDGNGLVRFVSTGAILLPVGTTGERPATAEAGMIRYNSTSNTFEGYVDDGTPAWEDLLATGGGSSKWSDGTDAGDIYYSSGFVGIGTADPDVTLQVEGASGEDEVLMQMQVVNDDAKWLELKNWAGTTMFELSTTRFSGGHSFFTLGDGGGTQRVAMYTNGNAGPGISVYSTGNAPTSGYNSGIYIRSDSGAESENGIMFGDGSFDKIASASLTWFDDGGADGGVFYGHGGMRLKTAYNGGTVTTRMQIDPDGTVRFSSTGAIVAPLGTEAQRPPTPEDGMIRYKTDTGSSSIGFEVREAGAWVAMGAAVSDERLKKDIKPLDGTEILERLSQVDTYSYAMKNDGTNRVQYGVLAQELQNVFPELVDGVPDDPENMMSVRYLNFIAPLIEATKELKSENDTLKTKLAALQSDQSETKETLTSLVKQVDLLNKAAGNKAEKASMWPASSPWLLLLLALSGGFGTGLLLIRRKEKPAA